MGQCASNSHSGGRGEPKISTRWSDVPGPGLATKKSSLKSATLSGRDGSALSKIDSCKLGGATSEAPLEQTWLPPLPPLEQQRTQEQPPPPPPQAQPVAPNVRKSVTWATKTRSLSTSLSLRQSGPDSAARAMALGAAAARAAAAATLHGGGDGDDGGEEAAADAVDGLCLQSPLTPTEVREFSRSECLPPASNLCIYADDGDSDTGTHSVLPLGLPRNGQTAWMEPAVAAAVAAPPPGCWPSSPPAAALPVATATQEEETGPQSTVVEEGAQMTSRFATPCQDLDGGDGDDDRYGAEEDRADQLTLGPDITAAVAAAAVAAAVAAAAAAARSRQVAATAAATGAVEVLPERQWQQAEVGTKSMAGEGRPTGTALLHDRNGVSGGGGGSGASPDGGNGRWASRLAPTTPPRPPLPPKPQPQQQTPQQQLLPQDTDGGSWMRPPSRERWRHSAGGEIPSPNQSRRRNFSPRRAAAVTDGGCGGGGDGEGSRPGPQPRSTMPGSGRASNPLLRQAASNRAATEAATVATEAVANAGRASSPTPALCDPVLEASVADGDGGNGSGGSCRGGSGHDIWTRSRAGKTLEMLRMRAAARAAEAENPAERVRLDYVPQAAVRPASPSTPSTDASDDEPLPRDGGRLNKPSRGPAASGGAAIAAADVDVQPSWAQHAPAHAHTSPARLPRMAEGLAAGASAAAAGGYHPELSPAERKAAFHGRKTVSERVMPPCLPGSTGQPSPWLAPPALMPTPQTQPHPPAQQPQPQPPQPPQPPQRHGLLLLQQSGPPPPDRGLTHQISLGHQARDFFQLMQQRRDRATSVNGGAEAATAATAGPHTTQVATEAVLAYGDGVARRSTVAGRGPTSSVLADRRMRLYPPLATNAKASSLLSKLPSGKDNVMIRKGRVGSGAGEYRGSGGGGSGGGFTAEPELLAPLPPPPQQQQHPLANTPPNLIGERSWPVGATSHGLHGNRGIGGTAGGEGGSGGGPAHGASPSALPTAGPQVPYSPQPAPLARARSQRHSEPYWPPAEMMPPPPPPTAAPLRAPAPHMSLPGFLPAAAEGHDAAPADVVPHREETLPQANARTSFDSMLARIAAQVAAAAGETSAGPTTAGPTVEGETAAGSGCVVVPTVAVRYHGQEFRYQPYESFRLHPTNSS